ncbi:hypothetical protein [Intrasporangium flavum]|uniref:hypothetical protein n=1 Tax=Intrasporangium flavum TaxID=1428657 RepID=UPI00096E75A4|nr:hypothetical protein [Intrasporangium flavum]
MRARVGLALGALAGVLLLAGCGDEMEDAMAETASGSTPAPLVCAKDAKPVALPDGFPSQATLPAGYVVSAVEARSGGRTVVTAVSPKAFEQTLADMQGAYSTRGWTASEGEVEERDAESNFDGNGLRGRWAIRQIPDCTGNTSVSVLIGK